MTSLTLLISLASMVTSSPLPQLTSEQFHSRARSLDGEVNPLVSQSYATVRRQGRKGSSEVIKFPTLEVRDPNELSFSSPVQKTAFAAGPVYVSSNALSTKDIEQKIKEINAVEVINKEEQILESVLGKDEAKEVEELVDIAAAEIAAEEVAEEIAEEIDELTDIAAAEIVAEEIAEELNELTKIGEAEVAIEKEIDELTDIAAAEIVAEELAEEIDEELLGLEIGSQEVTDEVKENNNSNIIEDSDSTNDEEGSGDVPKIDFGDIMEVVLL